MRLHHRGLRCPKWKRQNVFTFSEAHKQHVALVGCFFRVRRKDYGVHKERGAMFLSSFQTDSFRLPAPAARILFPSEKNKLCTWKHSFIYLFYLFISNSLSVPLLHPRETGSPWSVGSKCIDSLCQVVRILQDVFASSPTVLFSQDRTPKSIAQSPLPPGSTCNCHCFRVRSLRWGQRLQVHCGMSRIHSFELTARWVGDTSGSDTVSHKDTDGQREQLLEVYLLLLLATTHFLESHHFHRLVPNTLSGSVTELRQKELRTFWEFEHLTFWPKINK